MIEISFRVYGEPKAQPRPRGRAVKNKYTGKHTAMMYNPSTSAEWKKAVLKEALPLFPEVPYDRPIQYSVQFHLPRPKYMFAKKFPAGAIKHLAKPDIDNLLKAVFDVLSYNKKTGRGLYKDDTMLYAGFAAKYYCGRDEKPGATIKFIIEGV